ncbi:Vinculin family-domain-containing protein [Entophlyctis helioformis]|nr:Vinculin family-domain-containing protein [Entophlyctis helioformis]
MFTKTSKQVLSPLAEAVSALIVIISDAEVNGTPTPDLSQLSKAVDAQVANLLGVADKIVAQPSADAALKADMPGVCAEVTNASRSLIASTDELARNAVSPTGRSQLLEAVKGILSGTTGILNVFDDSEVRKILAASFRLRDLLDRLRAGVPSTVSTSPTLQMMLASPTDAGTPASATSPTPATPQREYIQVVTLASQTIVALAQLSTKRVGELLSDLLQSQLQDAIRVLTKESPLLVSACKVVLTAEINAQAAGADGAAGSVEMPRLIMAGVCERLEHASLRIDEIVQWKGDGANMQEEQEDVRRIIAERRRHLATELLNADPYTAAFASHPVETRKAYQDYVSSCNQNLQELKGSLASLSDPMIRGFTEHVIENVESDTRRLADLAIHGRRAPGLDDAQVDEEVRALVEASNSGFDAIETAIRRGLVGELVTTLGTLSEPSHPGTVAATLMASIAAQDTAAISASADQFAQDNRTLNELVQQTLSSTVLASPQLVQEVHIQHARVDGLVPAVTVAAALLASNPKDTLVQEHTKNVMASYVDAAKDLQKVLVSQEGVFQAHDLLFGAKSAFDQHAEALRYAIARQDREAMLTQLVSLQSAATQLTTMAEKEKEFSEDVGYKAELDMKMQVVHAVLPGLVTMAQSLLAQTTPASTSQLQELDLIIENLAAQLSGLGAAVQSHKGGKGEVLIVPSPVPVSVAHPKPAIEVEAVQQKLDSLSVGNGLLSVDHAGSARTSRVSRSSRVSNAARVEDEGLRALTAAISEEVLVEEEAPQLLSEEEAVQDPLKAAGQELKVEASVWSTDDNAIIAAVKSMSQRMLDLSTHHGTLSRSLRSDPSAKRSFIQSAQGIMIDADGLLKAAKPLVDACTDKRLRMQLQGTLNYIQTLAQQLKIVAAVKASSPLDLDTGVQLVSCAQNLMKTVKLALRDCVSCSLRVRKGSEGAAVSGGVVKFRKVVYAL